MVDFFRDVQFVLHGDASGAELLRHIKQHAGVVATAGKTRKGGNVVHLVGEDEDADALELTGAVRAELLRDTWVFKCVKAGKQVDKTAFLACAEAAPPASPPQRTPGTPKAGRGSAGASPVRPSPSVTRGTPGRVKGDKLMAWTPEEINTLIEFARENNELGVTGQKLWDLAVERDILPGRSSQAMRECAKRKRAFIEEGGEFVSKRRSMGAAAAASAQLERSLVPVVLESLAKASGQPLEHVGWAVYQCNGEFTKAQLLVFGRITMDDFHPWSDEEDRTIAKYARGIIAADEGGLTDSERFRRISLAHANLKDEAQEATRVRALIDARDFTEMARRAAYLVEP
jgi:hypothetical protein